MVIIKIVAAFDFLFLLFILLTQKYVEKTSMNLYLANKRAGKSTTEAAFIIKSQRKGEICYANAEDIKLTGLRVFDTYDLGKAKVKDAHIFIDELSLYFDNRSFLKKGGGNVSEQFIAWLRETGHHNLKVDMFSQSYDCDLRTRKYVLCATTSI